MFLNRNIVVLVKSGALPIEVPDFGCMYGWYGYTYTSSFSMIDFGCMYGWYGYTYTSSFSMVDLGCMYGWYGYIYISSFSMVLLRVNVWLVWLHLYLQF